MLEYYAITILVLAAGYFDFKTRTVPDVVSALSWFAILFPPFSIALAGYWFAAIYAAFSLYEFLHKNTLFGFGDVLMVPPIVAAVYSMTLVSWALAAIVVLVLFMLHVANRGITPIEKPMPLITWAAIAYCAALLAVIL